jgi:hypothetical protein
MKIGIFAPWGKGDLLISTGVLKYKDSLWPSSEVVWFCSPENRDLLSHNPNISEARTWPYPWGQIHVEWLVTRGERHGLLNSRKSEFKELSDLDLGYFSTPWFNGGLGRPLAEVPSCVFGIPKGMPWRPDVYLTKEEWKAASDFVDRLPFPFTIMLETMQKSGQSTWNCSMTRETMATCNGILGQCNFVFGSPNGHASLAGPGIVDCSSLSFRQCLSAYNNVDLFIGISSGISCLTAAWAANPDVRRIEFCSDYNSSTVPISPQTRLETSWGGFLKTLKTALYEIKG